MVLEYSLIACGPTVLCSYQVGANNYEAVAVSILPNIQTAVDARTSYTSNSELVRCIFYCCARALFPNRAPM